MCLVQLFFLLIEFGLLNFSMIETELPILSDYFGNMFLKSECYDSK